MATVNKTARAEQRKKLRKEIWPYEDPWTGENEKGWFKAPRTLPLILSLLAEKRLSGNQDPTKVYLELFSRHMDSGLIEMVHEADHAFCAGYRGTRGVRTWQERMKMLEELGFIRIQRAGNRIKYVLLVHPTGIIQKLRDADKISEEWWATYRPRQIETKEPSHEERAAAKKEQKVVNLRTRRAAKAAGAEKA